jgi:hypothetical protein
MPIADTRALRRMLLEDDKTVLTITNAVEKIFDIFSHDFRGDFSQNKELIARWHNLVKDMVEGRKTALNDNEVSTLTDLDNFTSVINIKSKLRDGAGRGVEQEDFCGYTDEKKLNDAIHAFDGHVLTLRNYFYLIKCEIEDLSLHRDRAHGKG